MSTDLAQMIRQACEQASQERGHANILIAGKTGVGKSTLINRIFQGQLAATGMGQPVTHATREYQKDGIPLTITDTRGIELERYEESRRELEQYVRERNRDSDPNRHLHVAWLCIAEDSRRVEPAETELAAMLTALRVPVIAVITKARADQGFRDIVRSLLPGCRQVLRVRALPERFDDGHVLEPMGLEALVEATFQVFPEGQANAFVAAQHVDLARKVKQSYKAVSMAATTAAGIGASPIPFADAALIGPVQVLMLARITGIFGLGLNEGFLATLVSGTATAVGGAYLGRAVVSGLLKLIPGAGTLVGGAVSGATAAALTTAFGTAYISALKTLAQRRPLETITPQEVADAFTDELKQTPMR